MSKDKDSNEAKPPPFSGNVMPANISFSMDDGDDEVTRRIGGAPSFLNPSFTSTTIAPPSFTSSMTQSVFSSNHDSSFSTAVRKEITQTASHEQIFRWNLHEAPTLPEFHPLERTAVFVPHSSPSKVSVRISNMLRERSVEAKYDNEKAKASCVTNNGVDFRVRLYRGRNQYNHGIIVEIQRRFGTSINFYSDTQAILDAAEGKTPKTQPIDDSLPKAEEDDFKAKPSSSLKMVSKMLSHTGYDAQYLAMQTLTSLTDHKKVGLKTARSIAKELILPGNDVGAKIAAMILDPPQKKEDPFGLRAMAMAVLSNVLKMVSGDIPDHLRFDLLPVLNEKLRNADNNPRMAHIAAKCIEHLIGNGDNEGLMEALQAAARVGNAKHAGLMRQAEVCLQKIGSR